MEAKRVELKKKHQGYEPTDAQVLASISSSELAKHCRRRTRGVEETRALIKGLLDSMWDLVDGTGLHLVNHESMSRVWEVQQKHLACIQDPPGLQLYTNTGSGLEKGDRTLDVLRCARGSSSLESFHKHQCAFIPGWRCNALHTQMYMLEGVSRWNINRSAQALQMTETSRTKIYDVRLMSSANALSNRVLGRPLLPEFVPPGKPTGERIAVQYLLAQSNRGDLLSQQDISAMRPGTLDAVRDEDSTDITVPDVTDITFQESTFAREETAASSWPILEESETAATSAPPPSEESESVTPALDTRCDSRGVPGWEAVDALASYLVGLNRTVTALSNTEVAEIVRLYGRLHTQDQMTPKYTLKSHKTTLPGPWRASRKRSGSAPGQQAAERLYMVHGKAAHRPDLNRVSECVALKLYHEFRVARNRPKDNKGRTFPIPQAIVMTYSHIKQLLEDSKDIMDQTDLLLVNINNTTVSSWLHDRQKRTERDSLLQGVQLPQQIAVTEELLPEPRALPSQPVQHGQAPLEFQEPENREGEARIRQRRSTRTPAPLPQSAGFPPVAGQWPPLSWTPFPQTPQVQPHGWFSAYQPPPTGPQAWPSTHRAPFAPPPHPQGWSAYPQVPPPHFYAWPSTSQAPTQGWPSAYQPPSTSSQQQSSAPSQTHPDALDPTNRHRQRRLQKAALEDQERAQRGEPPKKRHTKEQYHYQCKQCGQPKTKSTGHSQVRGKWYCPASGKTFEEWKDSL
ncbi:uncharacterized protein LOC128746500 [Synchiropus splendidus]|uniref:uncharacterized protein LOC128746500 n=1 Tax=Synchiropus splendidus TaxID=270530 RepID=UPI00237DC88C|nr:uncharacterized protein LOC128746500 [Synchiropus splendidus]XP_053699561.1 uncharacterized protein LOC128746500 [Synchiropus splendidus]XP_053699562.1 uncharacterized protein LOC128746500 [Synchiropus splendidus]XP_053699563.1 uncharacterized protein LOC128746500 [Synchiropus splendidus]XP_053699564.1 uncharacterized protein LOC128746500 [Synchiropus splendidus]